MTDTNKNYDLIIIGTGCAGYTASIYASRYKINHLIIGSEPGGTITTAHLVANYPGFEEIPGYELVSKFEQHAKNLGGLHKNDLVETIIKEANGQFTIKTSEDELLHTKSILLATGTKARLLGLENERKFVGKGISYCATCDAHFYKNKTVAIIGGGNSALSAAALLMDIAAKVYLIYRGTELKADPFWIEKVKTSDKVELLLKNTVTKLIGKTKLNTIELSGEYNNQKQLNIDGLFIEIGNGPQSELAKEIGVDLDDKEYIKTNPDQSTNIQGVFAAGDVTTGSNGLRQIITACSEAAVAANSIFKYLKQLK